MFASVRSTTLLGVVGRCVDVEVHVGVGLPGFTIVGQPDEVCRESRDRVRFSASPPLFIVSQGHLVRVW